MKGGNSWNEFLKTNIVRFCHQLALIIDSNQHTKLDRDVAICLMGVLFVPILDSVKRIYMCVCVCKCMTQSKEKAKVSFILLSFFEKVIYIYI